MGLEERDKDNATRSRPNWRNALPLLEIEKTMVGIALGRKVRGVTCAFRFEMLIRRLWQPASKITRSDPYLLDLLLCGIPSHIKSRLVCLSTAEVMVCDF